MGKPSKVRKVKIALGSNYVPPRGFKFEGSGNWKAKSQQRGNIMTFHLGLGRILLPRAWVEGATRADSL